MHNKKIANISLISQFFWSPGSPERTIPGVRGWCGVVVVVVVVWGCWRKNKKKKGEEKEEEGEDNRGSTEGGGRLCQEKGFDVLGGLLGGGGATCDSRRGERGGRRWTVGNRCAGRRGQQWPHRSDRLCDGRGEGRSGRVFVTRIWCRPGSGSGSDKVSWTLIGFCSDYYGFGKFRIYSHFIALIHNSSHHGALLQRFSRAGLLISV